LYQSELNSFLLSGFDSSLAETMAKRPTQAFEMLEEAAKIVADELTRPRQDNEPIDDDFQVQLISGSNSRSIRELSALDVGKLVKLPGIAVSSSTVKAKV
jgi:DNA replication licensing factor MCM5